MPYDNSRAVFDAALKVCKKHSKAHNFLMREGDASLTAALNALTEAVSQKLATDDYPYTNTNDLMPLSSKVRTYVDDLTPRIKFVYFHSQEQRSFQIRVSPSVYSDLKGMTDWNEVTDATKAPRAVEALFNHLVGLFGFVDCTLLDIQGADVGSVFGSLGLRGMSFDAGVHSLADFSPLERCVNLRVEAVCLKPVTNATQTLRSSLTFGGFEIATHASNPQLDDARFTVAEIPALEILIDELNDAGLLCVANSVLIFKPYVNATNSSRVVKKIR